MIKKIEIKGIFKDWEFGKHTIKYKEYSLWVSNGFMFFGDDGEPFLRAFNIWERLLIWIEFKKEIVRRYKKEQENLRKKIKKEMIEK